MVVRNNLSAINTLNTLNRNHSALAKSLQTVSSGMRINGAKDDASGYAISERMRVQIRSLNQDNRNTQNGHSMMKVAEGAVQSTVDILKTLKEKVINAANDTNTDSDRAQIQKELDQSIDQINDNANVTYNGKYLVDGSKNGKGIATYTALTNSSLDKTTGAGTALTDLKDRNGNNLGIQTSDTVTVSYVQNGKTWTGSYQVGTTSLQNIFQEAEDLDQGSTTFANQYNPALLKVNGVTDISLIQPQVTAAQTWADTTTKAIARPNGDTTSPLGSAETLYNQYSSLVTTLQQKRDDYYNALVNYDTLLYNATGTHYPYPNQITTATSQFQNLCQTQEGIAGTGCTSPTTLNSGSIASIIGNDGPSGSGANILPPYINAYQQAYTILTNWMASNPIPAASSLPTPPDVSLLPGGSTAYPTTYDTSSYLAYRDSAKQVATEAKNFYDSLGGPAILAGSKVGISRSDEIVYTANRENALTVTADGSGINGQISGFTVSVTDAQGNIKKSVNAVLDAWEETIRGENESKEDTAIVLQTGTRANQAIKVRLSDMRAQALGLQGKDGTTLNVSTQQNANAAINVLDNALQKALDQQTTIGSIESRLEYTSTNLVTAAENVTASESTIRDADMAKAMTEYTKNNILMQASQAMLAQANQSNNQVLSLLR